MACDVTNMGDITLSSGLAIQDPNITTNIKGMCLPFKETVLLFCHILSAHLYLDCFCVPCVNRFFSGVRKRAACAPLLTDMISQKDRFIQTFAFPISLISNEMKIWKLVLI